MLVVHRELQPGRLVVGQAIHALAEVGPVTLAAQVRENVAHCQAVRARAVVAQPSLTEHGANTGSTNLQLSECQVWWPLTVMGQQAQ